MNREPFTEEEMNAAISETIASLKAREYKLAKALKSFIPFDIGVDAFLLYGGDRQFQEAIEVAKDTLTELGLSYEST